MKFIRIMMVTIISVVLVGILGWCLAGWIIRGAFRSANEQGGFKQLSDVLEATVGATLARSGPSLQLGAATNSTGSLGYYQNSPQLDRDKRYFETWHSALAIADSSRQSAHRLNGWESSTEISWISPSHKTDSWGHAFCVQSDQQRAIVVSPGPQAMSSLDCSTLKVSEDELSKMPQGRLNPHASGALILLVKRLAETALAQTAER